MDVQYYLSVLYDNLGMASERDASVTRHLATTSLRDEVVKSVDGFADVLALVALVGAKLNK